MFVKLAVLMQSVSCMKYSNTKIVQGDHLLIHKSIIQLEPLDFALVRVLISDQGCARPLFHFETETETFGCWYQKPRLGLLVVGIKSRD